MRIVNILVQISLIVNLSLIAVYGKSNTITKKDSSIEVTFNISADYYNHHLAYDILGGDNTVIHRKSKIYFSKSIGINYLLFQTFGFNIGIGYSNKGFIEQYEYSDEFKIWLDTVKSREYYVTNTEYIINYLDIYTLTKIFLVDKKTKISINSGVITSFFLRGHTITNYEDKSKKKDFNSKELNRITKFMLVTPTIEFEINYPILKQIFIGVGTNIKYYPELYFEEQLLGYSVFLNIFTSIN